ncbi:hypothetical protein QT397_02145 (plasmid) [Microbulbifer sp. MKSA007]|nr:hypothetical protein QT397_02145 [Microbulbifer sp. MKSA007]
MNLNRIRMTTDTDIRLRSRLDANQRDREQMCRAILAIDPHYSDVRPRHPKGGPDGGRDIEATYDASTIAFGAVGFVNGANDSTEQKRDILKKFTSDLNSAHAAKPDLKAFAFLTNVHFTMAEQEKMKTEARDVGVTHCDILDRERLRIELDSPSGFFIRFQFLDIPLSPAEQASFLSKYGDQVQNVVTTGFQRVEKTLGRLLFLAEANDVLEGIHVRFVLKQDYRATDIGHFRAFSLLSLRAIKHDIMTLWFGSTDKSSRYRENAEKLSKRGVEPGIGAGISGGQWEQHFRLNGATFIDAPAQSNDKEDGEETDKFIQVGSSGGIGMDPVRAIMTHYRHDGSMIRIKPRLLLRDLDECSFMPVLNRSLAEKLHSFQIFANGYKLADYSLEDFSIDSDKWDSQLPGQFTPEELSDPWVRIRPISASVYQLKFSETTPRRLYEHRELNDTILPNLDRCKEVK